MGLWGKLKSGAKAVGETAADTVTGGAYSYGKEKLGLGESSSVIDDAIDGGKEVIGQIPGALGLTMPDTKQLATDTEELRRLRGQFAQDLAAAGPRDVPQVTAGQAAGAGPVQAAVARGAGPIDAPQLGPAAQATAAQASAAPVQRTGPTTAATIFGAGPATAGQMRAAEIQTGPQDQARGVQNEAIQATRDVLSGKTPSLAELQMREQLNRNVGAIQSRAAGARGLGAGAVRRQAAREMARAEADANQQGALVRANEVATARGQLGGLATDTRGQDLSLATNQAGLVQGERQFNAGEAGNTSRFNVGEGNRLATAQAGLQQQATQSDADRAQGANLTEAQLRTGVSQSNAGLATGVNTTNAGARNQFAIEQGRMQFGADDANAGRFQQNQQFNAGQQNTVNVGNADRTQQNQQFNTSQGNTVATNNADRTMQGRQQDDTRTAGLRDDVASTSRDVINAEQGRLDTTEAAKKRRTDMIGNVAQSGSAALAASDERLKKGIKQDPKALEEFLRDTKPVSFSFKASARDAPAAGPGKQIGVLAQDVEQSEIGDQLVVDGPGGKALDQGNFAGPLLAAMAHMNKKLNALAGAKRQAAKEMR